MIKVEPSIIPKLLLNLSDSEPLYSYKLYSCIHSTDFLNMLRETGFNDKHMNYIIRMLTIIAIRTTYYSVKEDKIGTIQSCYLPNYLITFYAFVTFTIAFIIFTYLGLDFFFIHSR